MKAILSGIQVNNPAAVAFWLSDRQWGTYLRGIMIVFDLRKELFLILEHVTFDDLGYGQIVTAL